jgi:hypothetical protein
VHRGSEGMHPCCARLSHSVAPRWSWETENLTGGYLSVDWETCYLSAVDYSDYFPLHSHFSLTLGKVRLSPPCFGFYNPSPLLSFSFSLCMLYHNIYLSLYIYILPSAPHGEPKVTQPCPRPPERARYRLPPPRIPLPARAVCSLSTWRWASPP